MESVQNLGKKVMKIAVHPADDSNTLQNKDLYKEGINTEDHNSGDPISFGSVWNDFRSETSLHGVQHVSRKKSMFRGVIWALAVTGMASFLTKTMYDLYQTYYSYPTLSRLKNERAKERVFPALTICNLSPYNKSRLQPDKDLDTFLLSISNVGGLNAPTNFSDPKYSSLREKIKSGWLHNVSFLLDSTLLACYFENKNYGCSSLFDEHVTEMGYCFRFNGNDRKPLMKTRYQGSFMGLKFYINVDQKNYVYSTEMGAGIKVMIHDANEEPNIRDNGHLISPGFVSNIGIQTTKYKYLPSPFKAFGDEYCLDTDKAGFKNPLKYHTFYSYYGCIRECKRQFVLEACNCQMPTDVGNETLCSFELYWRCYMGALWKFEGDGINNCDCLKPCSIVKYSSIISTSYFPADIYEPFLLNLNFTQLRNNYIELRIYFDTLAVNTIEQIPQYDMRTISANLGGQMGIFLGASILTLTELVEFVVFSIYVFAKRLMKRNLRNGRNGS